MTFGDTAMAKALHELTFKQIETAIEKLPLEQQQELARRLWVMRFEKLSEKMRRAAKKNKITQKDIDRVCEDVRQELYEKRLKSRHRH